MLRAADDLRHGAANGGRGRADVAEHAREDVGIEHAVDGGVVSRGFEGRLGSVCDVAAADFRARFSGTRETVRNGANPKRSATAAEMLSVNNSTVRSGAMRMPMPDHALRAWVAYPANNQPNAAPAVTSARLSRSNCRNRTRRPAPSAWRRPNSRCRLAFRAISSIATLAQAMSRIKPTMDIRKRRGCSYSSRRLSTPRMPEKKSCGFGSWGPAGEALASALRKGAVSCGAACSGETPGRRRPTMTRESHSGEPYSV